MSNNSKKRKKSKKSSTKHQQQQQGHINKKLILRKVFSYWNIFIGLIGTILAIYAFFPNVTANIAPALEKADVFSTPLIISNNNLYSINNVKIVAVYHSLSAMNKAGGKINLNEIDLILPSHEKIERHKSIAKLLRFVGGEFVQLHPSKITVNVDFEIFFIPWTFKELFKFESYQTIEGYVHWLPQ
jgi:hypothetical protein